MGWISPSGTPPKHNDKIVQYKMLVFFFLFTLEMLKHHSRLKNFYIALYNEYIYIYILVIMSEFGHHHDDFSVMMILLGK